jgi:hypothetical protein
LRKIATMLLREAADTPLAVLDMEDAEPLDLLNIPLFDRCRAYFKREIPSDTPALLRSPSIPTTSATFRGPQFKERLLAKLRPSSLGVTQRTHYVGSCYSCGNDGRCIFLLAVLTSVQSANRVCRTCGRSRPRAS